MVHIVGANTIITQLLVLANLSILEYDIGVVVVRGDDLLTCGTFHHVVGLDGFAEINY